MGFGGSATAAAAAARAMPTPSEPGAAAPAGSAVSISAPLTWSGDHDGCAARICEAAPATIGAAKDVPDIHM